MDSDEGATLVAVIIAKFTENIKRKKGGRVRASKAKFPLIPFLVTLRVT